jgi:hypothetical protein
LSLMPLSGILTKMFVCFDIELTCLNNHIPLAVSR